MSFHARHSLDAFEGRGGRREPANRLSAAGAGVLVWLILALIASTSSRFMQAVPTEKDEQTESKQLKVDDPAVADESPHVKRDAEGRLQWPRPRVSERQAERDYMVRRYIGGDAFFREAVKEQAVLDAMRAVPRHEFVPEPFRRDAYIDSPLPIGEGQTISQPYIVALMTALLELKPGDRVLEIGTGSGYQAAVLSELTPYVFTIENVKPLAERAAACFERLGYKTIRSRFGDGYAGWGEHAPFDAVIVTCAAENVPVPLWEQLKPGGRMVIPVGGEDETQQLVILTKRADGGRERRDVIPVRFVPMTGKAREP